MQNLFNFKSLILIVFSMGVFIWSCSKDTTSDTDVNLETQSLPGDGNGGRGSNYYGFNTSFDINFNINNPYRNQLAEIISITACRRPEIKEAIKHSVNVFKSTNNYYEDELFFNLEKDKPNSKLQGKSISQVLKETVPEKDVNGVINFLCKNDPGLAILLEGNLLSTTISNEVYIDENFDDSNLENEIFSYSCGTRNSRKLRDGENNPKMLLVIRESESYVHTQPSGVEFRNLGRNCGNDINIIGSTLEDVNNLNGNSGTDPNGNSGTDPLDQASVRTIDCTFPWRDEERGKETLYKFRTDNDYESMRGKGEFLIYVLYGKDLKYKYNESTGRLDITGYNIADIQKRIIDVKDDNKFRIADSDFFTWNTETNGFKYKIFWHEDDGGKAKPLASKITLTVKAKLPGDIEVERTIDVTFKAYPNGLSNGDDFIGETVIEYCHRKFYKYTPTTLQNFEFQVYERQ